MCFGWSRGLRMKLKWGMRLGYLVGVVYERMLTDRSIQTWALEEARRRLEKEGILEDPFPDHVEPVDEPK